MPFWKEQKARQLKQINTKINTTRFISLLINEERI